MQVLVVVERIETMVASKRYRRIITREYQAYDSRVNGSDEAWKELVLRCC